MQDRLAHAKGPLFAHAHCQEPNPYSIATMLVMGGPTASKNMPPEWSSYLFPIEKGAQQQQQQQESHVG